MQAAIALRSCFFQPEPAPGNQDGDTQEQRQMVCQRCDGRLRPLGQRRQKLGRQGDIPSVRRAKTTGGAF